MYQTHKGKGFNEIDVVEFCEKINLINCRTVREVQRQLQQVVGDKFPHYVVGNDQLMYVWLEDEVNVELLAENMKLSHWIYSGRLRCSYAYTQRHIEMLTMYGPGIVQTSEKWDGIYTYYLDRNEQKGRRIKRKKLLWKAKPKYTRG